MRRAIAALSAAALLAGTAACGANPPEAEGILNGKSSQGVDEAQLRQTLDHELHGRCPRRTRRPAS